MFSRKERNRRFKRPWEDTEPSLELSPAPDTEVPDAQTMYAVIWAGLRPWIESALKNEKLERLDRQGDPEAQAFRRELYALWKELPNLPSFKFSLGFAVGDERSFEIQLTHDHPAMTAAIENAPAFSEHQIQQRVHWALLMCAAMPGGGFKLKNPYSR